VSQLINVFHKYLTALCLSIILHLFFVASIRKLARTARAFHPKTREKNRMEENCFAVGGTEEVEGELDETTTTTQNCKRQQH
jgi:hypothetical protein